MFYDIYSYSQKLQEKLPESNFKLLSFSGVKKPCSFVCLTCNNTLTYEEADKLMDRARRGLKNICRICENSAQKKPREEMRRKIQVVLNNKKTIEPLEEIWEVNKKNKWLCKKCNHSFERSPSDFLKNSKCPWCEGRFQVLSEEVINEKTYEKYGLEYSILSFGYKEKKTRRILVKHNICGFIWSTAMHNFLQGHGCPRCKSSLGERKVRKYLEQNGFFFQEQVHFTGLAKKTLDFYLEENGKRFAIEYNGQQHYEAVDFFGGEEALQKQQQRDREKEKFCKENNIELIIIPYYDEHIIQTEELAQRLRGIKLTEH